MVILEMIKMDVVCVLIRELAEYSPLYSSTKRLNSIFFLKNRTEGKKMIKEEKKYLREKLLRRWVLGCD